MARALHLPRKFTLLRIIGLPARFFFRRLHSLFAENENALFFLAACIVGLLGGLAGAAFRWLFDLAVHGFWGRPGELVYVAMESPWFV
ncbi:MAG TPA: hypothetical protein VM737_05245, partial [Gemmatimonadota bacterium]|nr:hypothetical protein [Gemmatimonadota bacterium]